MKFFDKIVKNNTIMGLVAIATLVIVAYVLVYQPWKAKKDLEAPYESKQ